MTHDNWYAMPPSPDQWQSFVFGNLARKVPEIPQYIAGIEFNRIDPVLGDADGLVYLIGGLAAIPVTIRQNRMAPLDVMVSKNEDFYPISEAFLQKIYADNVIGEPSNEPGYTEDQVAEGPGQRIQYYNTVGGGAGMSAKLASEASYDTKVALRSEIEKSAKLLTFFNDKMPEMLEVLYSAKPDEAVKVASAEEELPELIYMYKTENGYKCNGESVSIKTASAFMDIVELTDVDKFDVMSGKDVYVDTREKTASIVLDSFVKDLPIEPNYTDPTEDTSIGIATVISVSGEILKGLLYRTYNNNVKTGLKDSSRSSSYRHIFICDKGYAVQEDVFVIDIVPVELKHVIEASVPTAPEVGKFGTVMSDFRVSVPFNICAVESYGTTTILRSASYDMTTEEFELNDRCKFYDVVDNRISLATNNSDAFQSVEGQNVTVALNGEGKIVVASQVYDYNDAVYTLMKDYSLDYTDATNVSDTALSSGRVSFKIAAEKDKKDTAKKDTAKKPSSSGKEKEEPTKGEKAQDELQAQQAQSEMDSANEQTQQAQANQQFFANQGQMKPVSQQDLNDIASMNDPSLMDAYITGKLTDVNTAGREQIMQASDAIINAIKAVGKILFLTRLGKIEYVKEDDAQLALNKLSDVAKSIGVASSQLQ